MPVAHSRPRNRLKSRVARIFLCSYPMANPAAEALARQIERKIERIDHEDDFAALGVAEGASPDEITRAHDLLARWFDPDRVETLGLPGLRVLAEKIVARLDEARWALCGPYPACMVCRTRPFAVGTEAVSDAA